MSWQRAHAEASNVTTGRSRLLLTTRDAGLVTALAAGENHFHVQLPLLGPGSLPISPPPATPVRATPARVLTEQDRQQVLAVLHQGRFQDRAPATVHATLLDEGQYLCSVRTMYRLLDQQGESRERRDHLLRPAYQKPESLTGPNQLWSWDIAKLRGPVRWSYFDLYVILDVFSRYGTGWMVAERESAELARRFLADTVCKYDIPRANSTSTPISRVTRAQPIAFLLADLSVTKSHSRPYVSNDNPFSESQFGPANIDRTSRTASGASKTAALIAKSFSLVQRRAPPLRDRYAHPGHGALWSCC